MEKVFEWIGGSRQYHIAVSQARNGKFQWHLNHRHGSQVATSKGQWDDRADAIADARLVAEGLGAPFMDVEEARAGREQSRQ